MTRLAWFLGGAILAIAGYDMALRGILGQGGYLISGVGIGIGCAVAGSLLHDALAGPRERL